MPRVLIVDDHRNTRESLALGFPLFGFDAEAVSCADEALGCLQRGRYDWVVSDVRMRGTSGLELARLLRERFPEVGVLLMTAYELTPEDASAMLALGIVLLIKPVTAEMLASYCAPVKRSVETECYGPSA